MSEQPIEDVVSTKIKPTKAQEFTRKAHEKTLQGILKVLKRKRDREADENDDVSN